MTNKPIICADVIAKFNDQFIIIKRLNHPTGWALVGGKQDPGETVSQAAIREFFEETGLTLTLKDVFGVYAELGRDPRGFYVSTVFTGEASGTPKAEKDKIEILFKSKADILSNLELFVFDHAKIIQDYFSLNS